MQWKSEIKYLGVHLLAGKTCKCNLQHCKQKFYRAANGIFGKIGSTKNPNVILTLVNSFCLPILLYGMEALDLNVKSRNSIDFIYNSVFAKLFNIKDKQTISLCQYYTGYLPASCSLDEMRKFFNVLGDYIWISSVLNIQFSVI